MPVNGFVVFLDAPFVPLGTHARSSLRGAVGAPFPVSWS
jgi:hypothetical protein